MLTTEEVQKIAHLARIATKPEEISGLQHELSNILHLIEQMNLVDTKDVTPMAHPLDMVQRLRPDAVVENQVLDDCQGIAPHTDEGYYLVPRVIE